MHAFAGTAQERIGRGLDWTVTWKGNGQHSLAGTLSSVTTRHYKEGMPRGIRRSGLANLGVGWYISWDRIGRAIHTSYRIWCHPNKNKSILQSVFHTLPFASVLPAMVFVKFEIGVLSRARLFRLPIRGPTFKALI